MRGKIKDFTLGLDRRQFISFELTGENRPEYDKLKDCADLDIEVKKHREKRSLDSNALLWKLIGEIATVIRNDKWAVYLMMLKRYGRYTHIVVKRDVVEAMKSQWREIEEVGEITVNGKEAVQLLCYFGSSTLNTQEFSVLLDGVISEAKELGIETASPEEVERMMDYERRMEKNKRS